MLYEWSLQTVQSLSHLYRGGSKCFEPYFFIDRLVCDAFYLVVLFLCGCFSAEQEIFSHLYTVRSRLFEPCFSSSFILFMMIIYRMFISGWIFLSFVYGKIGVNF